jgi:hypothetical protein
MARVGPGLITGMADDDTAGCIILTIIFIFERFCIYLNSDLF